MAVTLDTIRDRIIATVKAATLQAKSPSGDTAMTFVGDDDVSQEEHVRAGIGRAFEIFPGDDDIQEGGIQIVDAGQQIVTYVVVIEYPALFNRNQLVALAQMDAQDVKDALDNPANWGTDVYHQFGTVSKPLTPTDNKGNLLGCLVGVLVSVDFLCIRNWA